MSAVDPASCPPGKLHTEMTKAVRGLGVGQQTKLPDGAGVKAIRGRSSQLASRRVFVAMGHSQTDTSTHKEAGPAAKAALDYSARSSHPDSVGGKRRYPDLESFVGRNS